jgi:LPPG:FO 2-phospho-L-lactate transferase
MPDWFRIGDADLATHIVRTTRLSEGWTLSQVTKEFCSMWGIQAQILPMSDDAIETWIQTAEGDLPFQEYFVHRNCLPVVHGFKFIGIERSKPAPGILEAIDRSDAIVICPSNPWVSVDPILSIPGLRDAVENCKVLAVSPIIGDRTFKGPAAKMFHELGIEPSAFAVAQHYGSIIDGLMIDNTDIKLENNINETGIRAYVSDILMVSIVDRVRLANEIIKVIMGWEKVN